MSPSRLSITALCFLVMLSISPVSAETTFKVDGIRFAFTGGYTLLQDVLNTTLPAFGQDYPDHITGISNASYPMGGSIDLKGSWDEDIGINIGGTYVVSKSKNGVTVDGGSVSASVSETIIYSNLLFGRMLRKATEDRANFYIGAGLAMNIFNVTVEGLGFKISSSDLGEDDVSFTYNLVGGFEYLFKDGWAPFFELVYQGDVGLGFNTGVGFAF